MRNTTSNRRINYDQPQVGATLSANAKSTIKEYLNQKYRELITELTTDSEFITSGLDSESIQLALFNNRTEDNRPDNFAISKLDDLVVWYDDKTDKYFVDVQLTIIMQKTAEAEVKDDKGFYACRHQGLADNFVNRENAVGPVEDISNSGEYCRDFDIVGKIYAGDHSHFYFMTKAQIFIN